MIIEQTCHLIRSKYGELIENLTIEDVRIGLHLTAVRLSDNSFGTSATLADTYPFTPKSHRDFSDFTPLKIKGRSVAEILETSKNTNIISSVRNAVLSAISSEIISMGHYNIIENCDPIQLIDLSKPQTITIVGAFQSYIRQISSTDNRLFVLELNESALNPEHRKYFVPAGDFSKILPVSDIVIITGQTLVNGTIDDLLDSVSEDSKVIITGPSSTMIPDMFFENKVSIMGALKIARPDLLFDIVGEGGTGYHLFEYCARKICILKEDEAKAE